VLQIIYENFRTRKNTKKHFTTLQQIFFKQKNTQIWIVAAAFDKINANNCY